MVKIVAAGVSHFILDIAFLMAASGIAEDDLEAKVSLESLEQLRKPYEFTNTSSSPCGIIEHQSARNAMNVMKDVHQALA